MRYYKEPLKMPLTPMEELVVAKLTEKGESNVLLAMHFGVSEGTIRAHLMRAMNRTNLPNRTALALWYVRREEGVHHQEEDIDCRVHAPIRYLV